MFTYYIATTPQSIVEVVKTGRFPTNLPDWLQPKKIICTRDIQVSIKTCHPSNYHQIFILKLEVSSQLLVSQDESIVLERIDQKWIKSIFVYSATGQRLLENLLRNNAQYISLIKIAPEVYSSAVLTTTVSSIGTASSFFKPSSTVSSPSNRKRTVDKASLIPSSTIPASRKPRQDDDALPIPELRRISTRNEHIALLRSAFNEAQNSILITSYAITHRTLQATDLYPLIEQARKRKVKIYCYYNDNKRLEEKVFQDFTNLGIYFDECYTHAKILAVDRKWVALGSFNWLSDIDDRYPDSLNASILCKGELCESLIDDLWEYLIQYRRIQFGRYRQAERFDYYNDSSLCYEMHGRQLSYITTLDEQLGFFQHCFEKAKKRIVICLPFLSRITGYHKDLSTRLLRDVVSRGVEIFFICCPNNFSFTMGSNVQLVSEFSAYLQSIGSNQMHLLPLDNFHLKTIVVDDILIAEGSFNWMSASRDQGSDYHNHEVVIAIEGEWAKPLIDNFYNSEIGHMVIQNEKNDKYIPSKNISFTESNSGTGNSPSSLKSRYLDETFGCSIL